MAVASSPVNEIRGLRRLHRQFWRRNSHRRRHHQYAAGSPCQPFSIAGVGKKTLSVVRMDLNAQRREPCSWAVVRVILENNLKSFLLVNQRYPDEGLLLLPLALAHSSTHLSRSERRADRHKHIREQFDIHRSLETA